MTILRAGTHRMGRMCCPSGCGHFSKESGRHQAGTKGGWNPAAATELRGELSNAVSNGGRLAPIVAAHLLTQPTVTHPEESSDS